MTDNGWRLAFVADFATQNFNFKKKFDMENNTTTNHENGNDANRLLAAGDKVNHPSFGNGEIFEISQMLGFADVNLDKAYIDEIGRKRDTVIVPISELVACR